MNAHTDIASAFAHLGDNLSTPFHLTFTGAEIANWAKAYIGQPNRFGGRSGSGALDAVGLVMAVGACVCEPIEPEPYWCRDGGDLPLHEIPLEIAAIGDVLVLDMAGAAGWRDGWRWGLGILTRGDDIDSADAQFCHAWHGHACTLSWLKPYWRPYVVRAYRFARKA